MFFQAKHKHNGTLAALKQVDITSEEDIEDYSVEIDILTECKHQNIVGLHEAFFWENKLWVSLTKPYKLIYNKHTNNSLLTVQYVFIHAVEGN